MANENISAQFPQRRLRPYDGMAITAEVWEQAHGYHDQAQEAHNLYFHGPGILYGLDVIASDPPDQMVYILPGAAVDAAGKVIVLPEVVAYDIGNDVEGQLYLLISHRQSASPNDGQEHESRPKFVEDQFLITARSSFTESAGLELARFNRSDRSDSLRDAADPLRPGANEIDLRSRLQVRSEMGELLNVGVIYLGEGSNRVQGRGMARASREIRQLSRCQLVVDDDVQLGPAAARYGLLYLVAENEFQISPAQGNGLHGFLERGGTLLMEAESEAAQGAFIELCSQIGVGLARLTPNHPILSDPYLFNAAPPGFAPTGEVLAGDGVTLSTWGYGRLWSGEMPEIEGTEVSPVSRRETLRASIEWMANLLHSAIERRRAVQG